MDDTISIFDVNWVKFLHHLEGHYMPGPGFPTGGLIMGNIGILEAYRTKWGRIIVRGKTEVELLDSKTKRSAVIIKETPLRCAADSCSDGRIKESKTGIPT